MTDADILRSQIPTSTDPERLEREAARAEGKWPAWCCQTCGACIGYLGRAFQWLRIPLHECEPQQPIENLGARTVDELLASGRTVTVRSHEWTGCVVFSTRGGGEILRLEADGRLTRGADFRTDDAASVALLSCLSEAVPGFLRDQQQRLDEAKRHISKLTSFYMDNVLWGQACERARAFVEKMGSPAVAAPLTPDRPSPPATQDAAPKARDGSDSVAVPRFTTPQPEPEAGVGSGIYTGVSG